MPHEVIKPTNHGRPLHTPGHSLFVYSPPSWSLHGTSVIKDLQGLTTPRTIERLSLPFTLHPSSSLPAGSPAAMDNFCIIRKEGRNKLYHAWCCILKLRLGLCTHYAIFCGLEMSLPGNCTLIFFKSNSLTYFEDAHLAMDRLGRMVLVLSSPTNWVQDEFYITEVALWKSLHAWCTCVCKTDATRKKTRSECRTRDKGLNTELQFKFVQAMPGNYQK